MDKQTQQKLTKNFPKDVVKPAPKGKFGSYVPHHIYTQRLVDVIPGGYDFTYEIVRAKDNSIIGAKCKLYIKSTEQTIEEVGDVDMNALNRNITESELLKLAVSDGIKRCCMRLGLGLELWTGDTTEEEHYAGGEDKPKQKVAPPKPVVKQEEEVEESEMKRRIKTAIEFHEPDEKLRETFKTTAWKSVKNKDVDSWTQEEYDTFLDAFVEAQENFSDEDKKNAAVVDEIFKTELIEEKMIYPDCATKNCDIEDNREKKAKDPDKFGKIPDFACQKPPYGKGCGKAWWINNAPESWL